MENYGENFVLWCLRRLNSLWATVHFQNTSTIEFNFLPGEEHLFHVINAHIYDLEFSLNFALQQRFDRVESMHATVDNIEQNL